ncbi:MAG: hypothetical protein AAF402_08420 [Pseudomonadota bacterium]
MSGKQTIMLLEHHQNPRDDVVTNWIRSSEFEFQVVNPFLGDPLPKTPSDYHGCVVYGGEHNLTEISTYPFLTDELKWIEQCIEHDLPLLGICLGGQMIAQCLGGDVDYHPDGLCEFGYYEVTPTAEGDDFMESSMHVVQAHYQGFTIPSSCVRLATGQNFRNQAFSYGENTFGVQFHPEIHPGIFKRWQVADWAMHDKKGAQPVPEQTEMMNRHGDKQTEWFESFLADLFLNRQP